MSLLLVKILTSVITTFSTEESSRYWPRLPMAIPLPPWQVIYVILLVYKRQGKDWSTF